MNYKQYLVSDHWNSVRRGNTLKKRCFVCLSPENIDLHHKTYKRLGQENVDRDLIYLCRDCHTATHIFIKKYSYPGMNIFNVASKLKKELRDTGSLTIKEKIRIFIKESGGL